MYKKPFGIVLIVHIIALGYIALRNIDSDPSPQADSDAEIASSENASSSLEGEDDILEEAPANLPPAPPAEEPLEFDFSKTAELPVSLRIDDLKTGFIVELPSGRVLWEKDSSQPVEIASMTKMMTALLAFEDVEKRDDLSMDTEIQVTNAAYRIGGSQVWLDPRERFTLEELLISVMVKSANDSAYLIGESLEGGDMTKFIERMNERATALEMSSTRFLNAHGLPEGDSDNTASCQDLARLAKALLRFEKSTEWASLQTHTFRPDAKQPTLLANHNRLLTTTQGVDGMKTGYTKRAGYCITATAERQGRRLIAVVTGFGSSKRRDECARDLIDWAYTQ